MSVTVTRSGNVHSPKGNALALYKDADTGEFFVKDILGRTQNVTTELGEQTLQQTLDFGNVATQDIILTGVLSVLGTSNGIVNNGRYTDTNGSNGTDGQLLSSEGGQTEWVDAPSSGVEGGLQTADGLALTSVVKEITDTLGNATGVKLGTDDVIEFTKRISQTGLGKSTFFGEDVGLNDGGSGNNTAFGHKALTSCTTGSGNDAFGDEALRSLTIGNHNTAIGRYALYEHIDGEYNVAVGRSAMDNCLTGSRNVGVGHNALNHNAGDRSTAVGDASLYNNTTASRNTAVGEASMTLTTTGGNNTAIGVQSMLLNTIGTQNVAVGEHALWSSTTANNNTGIGYQALRSANTGNNVALGRFSGRDYVGSGSVFLGHETGRSVVGNNKLVIHNSDVPNPLLGGDFSTRILEINGLVFQGSLGDSTYFGGDAGLNDDKANRDNVGVGKSALVTNTSGESNVAVGKEALFSNSSGSGNVAVGRGSLMNPSGSRDNCAIGTFSLLNLEDSREVVAVGKSSGVVDSLGDNVKDANSSVFLGANSRPLRNNEENQIVIGTGAVGNGSNTATIGDANLSELHLMGNGGALALRSPNGTLYKLSVSDAGALVIS